MLLDQPPQDDEIMKFDEIEPSDKIFGTVPPNVQKLFSALRLMERKMAEECHKIHPLIDKSDHEELPPEEANLVQQHVFSHREVEIAKSIVWANLYQEFPSLLSISNCRGILLKKGWKIILQPQGPGPLRAELFFFRGQ